MLAEFFAIPGIMIFVKNHVFLLCQVALYEKDMIFLEIVGVSDWSPVCRDVYGMKTNFLIATN